MTSFLSVTCPTCRRTISGEEPKPPEILEKSTEPIVGWRIWEYKERYLRSVFKTEFSWPYRVPLTKDVCHDAGIHTVKTFNQALGLVHGYFGVWGYNSFFASMNCRPPFAENAAKVPILGSCYLWGEVKDHAKGYLAECAYPKELYMAENTDPLTIFQIEEDYGVPVHLRKELNREEWDHESLNSVFNTYYNFSHISLLSSPYGGGGVPAHLGTIVKVTGNPNGSV